MKLTRREFAFAAAALPLAMTQAHAADTAQLRIATVAPAGSSFHKRLQALGNEWAKGPGGVSMNIYAGTQGGEQQIVRRMRVGQLQGAMLSSVGLSQIDRSVLALQYLPLLFRDWGDVDAVAGQAPAATGGAAAEGRLRRALLGRWRLGPLLLEEADHEDR
jgi:TRAP-type C4-dicarboxylate transport system substrate-binding protein